MLLPTAHVTLAIIASCVVFIFIGATAALVSTHDALQADQQAQETALRLGAAAAVLHGAADPNGILLKYQQRSHRAVSYTRPSKQHNSSRAIDRESPWAGTLARPGGSPVGVTAPSIELRCGVTAAYAGASALLATLCACMVVLLAALWVRSYSAKAAAVLVYAVLLAGPPCAAVGGVTVCASVLDSCGLTTEGLQMKMTGDAVAGLVDARLSLDTQFDPSALLTRLVSHSRRIAIVAVDEGSRDGCQLTPRGIQCWSLCLDVALRVGVSKTVLVDAFSDRGSEALIVAVVLAAIVAVLGSLVFPLSTFYFLKRAPSVESPPSRLRGMPLFVQGLLLLLAAFAIAPCLIYLSTRRWRQEQTDTLDFHLTSGSQYFQLASAVVGAVGGAGLSETGLPPVIVAALSTVSETLRNQESPLRAFQQYVGGFGSTFRAFDSFLGGNATASDLTAAHRLEISLFAALASGPQQREDLLSRIATVMPAAGAAMQPLLARSQGGVVEDAHALLASRIGEAHAKSLLGFLQEENTNYTRQLLQSSRTTALLFDEVQYGFLAVMYTSLAATLLMGCTLVAGLLTIPEQARHAWAAAAHAALLTTIAMSLVLASGMLVLDGGDAGQRGGSSGSLTAAKAARSLSRASAAWLAAAVVPTKSLVQEAVQASANVESYAAAVSADVGGVYSEAFAAAVRGHAMVASVVPRLLRREPPPAARTSALLAEATVVAAQIIDGECCCTDSCSLRDGAAAVEMIRSAVLSTLWEGLPEESCCQALFEDLSSTCSRIRKVLMIQKTVSAAATFDDLASIFTDIILVLATVHNQAAIHLTNVRVASARDSIPFWVPTLLAWAAWVCAFRLRRSVEQLQRYISSTHKM